MKKYLVLYFALLFTIAGCGGAGSGTTGTPAPANTRLPASIIVDDNTSAKLLDVDGDGDLDMFLGRMWRGTVDNLLINNGAGRFSFSPNPLPARYGGAGWGVVSAYSADLDNDGDQDLLLSLVNLAYSQGYLQLLLNDGTGLFTDASAQIPQHLNERWRHEIRIADLDGDGLLDFISGGTFSDNQRVYLNTGGATFTSSIMTAGGGGHIGISSSIGDVNADGKPDLVDISGGSIKANINQSGPGTIGFSALISPINLINPLSVLYTIQTSILTDFDNDGDLDLVADCYYDPSGGLLFEAASTIFAFQNDGLGNFTNVTATVLPNNPTSILAEYLFADDFTGDGFADVFIAENGPHNDALGSMRGGQSKLLVQTGGTLVDETVARLPDDSGGAAHGATYGDIDGDGDLDVYLSNINDNFANRPYFFIKDCTGNFSIEQ